MSIKREVYGIHKLTGERIYLGSMPMTDDQVSSNLEDVSKAYGGNRGATLRIRFCVYNIHDFAGIQFTPGPKE